MVAKLGFLIQRKTVVWLLCLISVVVPMACGGSSASTTSLDSNFGGLSMGPNDNSIVNVYMVNPNMEQAKALAKRKLGYAGWQDIERIRTVKVKYSLNQLEEWFRLVYDDLRALNYEELSGGGVDITENRVRLRVVCGAALDKVKSAMKERMVVHSIPRDAVDIEVTGQARIQPKPMRTFMYACMPPEVVDPATGDSSPGFGGFYFESDTIHVYLLEPSDKLAMELALIYFGRKIIEERGEVRAIQGQFTWEQLQAWYRPIHDGRWRRVTELQGAIPCDVEAKLNRITIEVRRSVNEYVVEEVEKWLSEIGVPKEAVTLIDGDIWPGRVPIE